MDTGNSERRKHFRGSARPGRRIDIKFRDKGTQDEHQSAITRNIGVGGAFIVTEERPDAGRLLELLIAMPDKSEDLVVDAEVRWVTDGEQGTKGGIGVKFMDLDVPSLLALSDYFATLGTPSQS
ncbi:MAG: PilZ domain-containing protein [Deltaproteobacteria bacterium]|nr:PilZ domain-containing protein [Deltaproteobacteria bacterium]